MGSRWIRLAAAFFLGVVLYLPPVKVVAQSSLSACYASASAAAQCAEIFGTREVLRNNIVPLTRAGSIVARDAAGSTLATTALPPVVTAQGGGSAILASSALVAGATAHLLNGYLNPQALQDLQNLAAGNFCAANPSACQGYSPPQSGVTYTWQIHSDYTVVSSGQRLSGITGSFSWVGNYPVSASWQATGTGGGNIIHNWYTGAPTVATPIASAYSDVVPTIVNLRADGQDLPQTNSRNFADLNEEQRAAAIGTLTDEQLGSAVDFQSVDVPIPGDATGLSLEGGTGVGIGSDLLPGDTLPVHGADPVDTDGDGIPDTSDPDVDGDGVPDYQQLGTPTSDPVDLTPIEPTTFEAVNFIEYAKTAFEEKFPFDVLGDLPTGGSSNECPAFTFFGRRFELCIVRDAVGISKIPAVIGFTIWALLTL